MKIFVRAVISGFGYSLGAALYKQVSKRLGLDDDSKKPPVQATDRDADGVVDGGGGNGHAEPLAAN